METPRGLKKSTYNTSINSLIAAIETSFENHNLDLNRRKLQQHLDKLAEKYQHDEQLGKLRHKLYDAQALLFYYSGRDERALDFAEAAEEVNDGPTSISSQIKSEINDESSATKNQKIDKPNQPAPRIEGWLAILILALVIGVAYNTYSFFSGLGFEDSITPDIEVSYPGLTALVNIENAASAIAAICGIALIILIFQKKKFARYFGIFFLSGIILFSIADLIVASSMFANSEEATAAINEEYGTYGRMILFSILWGGYLIFSKRVKATLIR